MCPGVDVSHQLYDLFCYSHVSAFNLCHIDPLHILLNCEILLRSFQIIPKKGNKLWNCTFWALPTAVAFLSRLRPMANLMKSVFYSILYRLSLAPLKIQNLPATVLRFGKFQ